MTDSRMPPRLRKPSKLSSLSVRSLRITQNISCMLHGFLEWFVPKQLGTKGNPEDDQRRPRGWVSFSHSHSWELLEFKGRCCFVPKEKHQILFACYVKDVIRSCQWAEHGLQEHHCNCLKLQANSRSAGWCFTLLLDAPLCSHLFLKWNHGKR